MRLLLVTSRYPWPPFQGDRKRARQMIEALAARHELTLLCPRPDSPSAARHHGAHHVGEVSGCTLVTYRPGGPWARAWRTARAVLAGRPVQCGLSEHRELGRHLRRLAPDHDLVILQLGRLAGHLRDVGDRPLLVDFIDSLALNTANRARRERFGLRLAGRWEAWRLRVWEERMLRRARIGLVVSERDRAALAPPGSPLAARLRVLPLAQEVGEERPDPPPEPATLIFTGNLGYFPNVDAACWLLEEVWPALAARRPEVRFRLAGARPARRLRAAVRRAPHNRRVVLDADPEELRGLLVSATLALAPMRAGSGLPIKILEAWASGVPVVASAEAAAGTTADPESDLLVAAGAHEWVAAIERLLDEPAARRQLAAAGRRRLALEYSPQRVRAAYLSAVEEARP